MKLRWSLEYLYLRMKKVYFAITAINYAMLILGIWATIVLFTDWLTFNTYYADAVLDASIVFKFLALMILGILAILHW